MSCNYQETDVSKISRDIAECKASSDRIAKLADKITGTITQNEKNKDKYNKDIYLWNRAQQQFINNIATISDRIRKLEGERQSDWGARCGALGQYDYHCQLGNFLNQELYPQLAVQQKRYNDFLAAFPRPTLEVLQVPNFENNMVCQACVQCVNQSNLTAGGGINTSLSQVNNCTINLERRLEDAKKVQPKPEPSPISIPPKSNVTPIYKVPQNPQIPQISQNPQVQKNNTGLILLLLFIVFLVIALGSVYYFREDIFGADEFVVKDGEY